MEGGDISEEKELILESGSIQIYHCQFLEIYNLSTPSGSSYYSSQSPECLPVSIVFEPISDCQPSYVAIPILFQEPYEELLPLYIDDEYDDEFFQFADIQSQLQPLSPGHKVDE